MGYFKCNLNAIFGMLLAIQNTHKIDTIQLKYLLSNEETTRLKFRPLEQSDFDNWVDLFKEQDVARFLDLDQSLSPTQLCQKWFDKVFHRYENGLGGMNVLIDKSTNHMVGQCGLMVQTIEEEWRLEVGYAVLPTYWGKGYASEAAVKCRNFGFENNFSHSIISNIHIDNISSETVALKNGMTFEKRLKDFNIFSIDRASWQNKMG